MSDTSTRDPLGVDSVVVARAPQPRGDGANLAVYDDGGALGWFVETEPAELIGSAVVQLLDVNGAVVLAVTHPGGATRARVDAGAGPLGFVSRVGRVRANLELHGPGRRPEGDPLLVLKPLEDGGGWHADGVELRAWPLGSPTSESYAEARYQLTITAAVAPAVRPLLLALPVLVDRSLTQAG